MVAPRAAEAELPAAFKLLSAVGTGVGHGYVAFIGSGWGGYP